MPDNEADRLIRDIENLFDQACSAGNAEAVIKIGHEINNKIDRLKNLLGNEHPTVKQLRDRQKCEREVRHRIVPPDAPEKEPMPPPNLPIPNPEPDVSVPRDERPPLPIPPRLKLLAVLGGVVFVFSLLMFCGMQLLAHNIIASNLTPTAIVRLTSTLPVTPSATPTITPTPVPIVVEKIDPVRLTGATQPWNVTLTGSNLSAVQTIGLQPADQDYDIATLLPLMQSDTQIALNLDELYPTANGQVTYILIINNRATDKQIIVQDFIRSAQVLGVHAHYFNRSPRLFFDEPGTFGTYLWNEASLQTRVSANPRPGDVVVSLDDTVEILEEAQDTHAWPVYRVRVRSNIIDGHEVIGKTGWISQWLVDGRPVPPEPTPLPTPLPTPTPDPLHFLVDVRAEDGRMECAGGSGMSYIGGTVYDRSGSIIYNAHVQVIPLEGQGNTIESTDVRNYAARNLRCGWWRIQLVAVGNKPVSNVWKDVHVTGEQGTGAEIDFRQR
jgi:hypothetical protein